MSPLLFHLTLMAVYVAVLSSPSRLEKDPVIPAELADTEHGVKMGVTHVDCDDAKSRLETDWDGSPVNYTCFTPKTPLEIRDIPSTQSCVNQTDPPIHVCTTSTISYEDSIPTSGAHRPLWPVFGEYKFVPLQRWIHNLEHGAVVMLYHPCTHPSLVDRLRKLVTSCIRKHIITPYQNLPADRPLALITWGCKMQMNQINDQEVIKFIREHGMHAPEYDLVKDGQYDFELIKRAEVPLGSNIKDEFLCPSFP